MQQVIAPSLLFLSTILSLVHEHHCFSIANDRKVLTIERIKSLITNSDDATTLPPKLLLDTTSTNEFDNQTSIAYSSDLTRSTSAPISFQEYVNSACNRHQDCINLFDRYETKTIRCETISTDSKEFNIRWEASWIAAGSTWLFNLADLVGWEVQRRVPDPSQISTFSWKNVAQVFQKAFETGIITLPVSVVEGSTRVKIKEDAKRISIVESIDLIREADTGRLQNRRVAQELASWLDVSRRPENIDEDEWAAAVRERVLVGVPGAGPLDVDPNEENEGAVAVLIFGVICVAALAFSYNVLVDEVVGGTVQVSALCDDAAKIEVGTGLFSECFGPYGDRSFLK